MFRATESIISGICRRSKLLAELSLNCRPYHRGGHWDGLHCTQDQEAEAYFVLDVRPLLLKLLTRNIRYVYIFVLAAA